MCSGVLWCALVCSGMLCCVLVCFGVLWCVLVCSDVFWCVPVCSDVFCCALDTVNRWDEGENGKALIILNLCSYSCYVGKIDGRYNGARVVHVMSGH